jgi:hypothetical protein
MSMKSEALAEGGTPTYVTRFDGVRVPATDYRGEESSRRAARP